MIIGVSGRNEMVDIMPKGELDILHPKLSVSWAVTAALVVIMILAVVAIGYWGFSKVKSVVPATTAGDF